MTYQYAAMLISANNHVPPEGKQLHESVSEYYFYPFLNEGRIFTIDPTLWRTSPRKVEKNADLQLILAPTAPQINSALESAVGTRSAVLLGLLPEKDWLPPGGTEPLQLIQLGEIGQLRSSAGALFFGFDVVDMTGISGLANIGLSEAERREFQHTEIRVNRYGLLNTENDAKKVAELSSVLASEHAPFVPVGVWGVMQ